MKISVVIAYHDEKQYIKDCLASPGRADVSGL